jgi:hypothetical protein
MLALHAHLNRLLERRCFLLLLALLAMLVGIAILGDTRYGRTLIGLMDVVILIAAVSAVGRSRLSLVLAGVLGVPVLILQIIALNEASPEHLALSWGFGVAFYIFALVQLLRYVLHPAAITADKLYGAVAVYLMLGITWAFAYGVLQYFHDGAFTLGGTPKLLEFSELIYFSFVVLTSTGFGDILPAVTQARFLVILEVLTGVMYVAILVARLTGIYPGKSSEP